MKKGKKQGNAKSFVRRRCAVAEIVMKNEDLLIEIFLRLPTKSLVRFMLVSKDWRRLIIDPNFAASHTRRNPNFVSSAIISFAPKEVSISNPKYSRLPKLFPGLMRFFLTLLPPKIHIKTRPRIVDSCNGLVLFYFEIEVGADLYVGYFVGNPTTQNVSYLRPLKCEGYRIRDALVFDPSESPHFLVVQVRGDRPHPIENEFAVYRSELDSWEFVKFRMPLAWDSITRPASFWNRGIHWISNLGLQIWFDPYSNRLLLKKLPLHPRLNIANGYDYFGECDGRFFLIQHMDEAEDKPGFIVFEMGCDCRSWIATYEVNLGRLAKDDPTLERELKFGFYIMSIVKGGIREGLLVVVKFVHSILSYGLETKKWGVTYNDPDCYGCYPFIETLTPVGGPHQVSYYVGNMHHIRLQGDRPTEGCP